MHSDGDVYGGLYCVCSLECRLIGGRLFHYDHFHLAMEVSTKCQVDISTVWASLGEVRALQRAKGKFRICFKV